MEKDIRSVEEYYANQVLEWKAFRLFWTIMALVLLAAMAGLFGDGYISSQTYTAPGLRIDYDKFMRVEKDEVLYIQVQDLGKAAAIGINNDYLKKVRISQVVPEPTAVEVRNNTLIYRFQSPPQGLITFYLSPQQMGAQALVITLGGRRLRFDQFIYF